MSLADCGCQTRFVSIHIAPSKDLLYHDQNFKHAQKQTRVKEGNTLYKLLRPEPVCNPPLHGYWECEADVNLELDLKK